MEAGIQVYNNSGLVQITSDFSNMQLTYKGSASNGTQLSFPSNELLAMRIDNGWFTEYYNSRVVDNVAYHSIVSSGTVNYYRFGYNVTPPDSAGLKYFEIYGSNGSTIFSANMPYMRVADGRNGVWYYQHNGGSYDRYAPQWVVGQTIDTFAGDPSRVYAIVVGQTACCFSYTRNYGWTTASQVFSFSNNVVTTNWQYMEYRDSSVGSDYVATPYYNYLVIDVTGY